jgi:hypothetical protein
MQKYNCNKVFLETIIKSPLGNKRLKENSLFVLFGDNWHTVQPFYQYCVWYLPLSEA